MAAIQKRILVPTKSVDDWRALLADPRKHWADGKSAKSAALSWEKAKGLPRELRKALANHSATDIRDSKLLLAIPEYKVPLDGGSKPSQNDVLAVLYSPSGLITMTVEAKCAEPFGDRSLGEWRKSVKKWRERLADILGHLNLVEPIPDTIRYQILHRAASAVKEAVRFHAGKAIMVVQSFTASDAENHFADFEAFLGLYHKKAEKGVLIELTHVGEVTLYAGWVQSPKG